MIKVRCYRESDIEYLAEIFRRAVREIAAKEYTSEQVRVWARGPRDFAARLRAKPAFVAEIDEKIAGFTDLDDVGHIDFLYVSPDFQRKGVATALLEFVIAQARQSGRPRLFSEVSVTARPVFERAGFHLLEARTVVFDGCAFQNFAMERRL